MASPRKVSTSLNGYCASPAGEQKPDQLETFLDSYDHFIRLDIDCQHIDDERPHELVDALLKSAEQLCEHIWKSGSMALCVALWPTLLVTDEDDARISLNAHQDRGTILLGLKSAPDIEADAKAILEAVHVWSASFRCEQLLIDYDPRPTFRTYLVDRRLLGRLVMDPIMYPELASKGLMIWEGRPKSEASDRLDVLNVDIDNDSPQARTSPRHEILRAGSSAAAAAARRSPSPAKVSKKLTPADEIRNRLIYDDKFDASKFVIVYEDRLTGLAECPVAAWQKESTEETFIPQHRIRAFKRSTDGRVVWHRTARINLIEEVREEGSVIA